MSKGFQYEFRNVSTGIARQTFTLCQRFIQLSVGSKCTSSNTGTWIHERFDQRPKQFLQYDG